MNETTPPPNGAPAGSEHQGGARGGPDASGAPGAAAPGDQQAPRTAAHGAGFFGWLRSLGIARGDDRWFAGVASGLAARAGIDPIIVRGVFVVLTILGGPGIVLYLACWLLLPDRAGRIHVEEILRGRAETWVLVTGIVVAALVLMPLVASITVPALAPVFSAPWSWDLWGFMGTPDWVSTLFSVLWWVAVSAAVVWAVVWLVGRGSRRPGDRATGGASTSDPASYPSGSPFVGAEGFTPSAEGRARPSAEDQARPWAERTAQNASEWGERAGERAAAWSQDFGQRAAAWGEDVGQRSTEWSREYEERHRNRSVGAVHVILTLALALLAGGLTAQWSFSAGLPMLPGSVGDGGTALVLGLVAAVAVLALSLIVAGIRGRHTGWVGFLAACGVVALLVTAVLPWGTRFAPFGAQTVQLAGQDQASRGVVILAGSSTVDLGGLDGARGTSDYEVWMLAGNTTVELPDRAPATVHVHVLAGNIAASGTGSSMRQSGPFLSRSVSVNLPGERASRSTDVSEISIYLLAGNVRIEGADGPLVDTTTGDGATGVGAGTADAAGGIGGIGLESLPAPALAQHRALEDREAVR